LLYFAAVRRFWPRSTRNTLILTVLLLVAGCSEPPQKEIDQAEAALDLARTGGAQVYAAEEYTAAAAGIEKAHAAVDQRDYRQALSYAIDARQRAQNALRQATEGKAKAQRAAETTSAAVSTQLNQLEARLKTAETARVPAKELRAPRAVLADARTGLQEARTQIGAGNYVKAEEILSTVRKKLDAAIQDVENIPQRAPRSSRKR
jgi:hypothetical protein